MSASYSVSPGSVVRMIGPGQKVWPPLLLLASFLEVPVMFYRYLLISFYVNEKARGVATTGISDRIRGSPHDAKCYQDPNSDRDRIIRPHLLKRTNVKNPVQTRLDIIITTERNADE